MSVDHHNRSRLSSRDITDGSGSIWTSHEHRLSVHQIILLLMNFEITISAL